MSPTGLGRINQRFLNISAREQYKILRRTAFLPHVLRRTTMSLTILTKLPFYICVAHDRIIKNRCLWRYGYTSSERAEGRGCKNEAN